MKPSIALLIGLAAQQVTATWDRHAGRFNSPQYNNNECSDKQKDGFNWQDLPQGDFSGYGDFNFRGGWKCSNSFGKRDSLTKRTFNSKCIKNKVARERPASFDCSTKKEGFSVSEIQVSVEFDCDLEFHYKMPDNSICKQIAPCKKEGTIVQNTQCGGAREVDVYLGNHNQQGREDCEIGFHHIGFDCNPAYTPSPPPETPTPTPTPETSSPAETPSSPAETPSSPAETPSSTPVETPSPPPAETPSSPAETPSSPAETPSPPPVETPIYGNSTAPPALPPASSPPSNTVGTESSTTAFEGPGYTPSPPVNSPVPETSTPGAESSTPAPESPSSPPSSTAAVESSSAVPSPPSTTYTPPQCLPKCMNTWLEINSKCKDNTDSDCYCKNPEFTKSVIECVAAWATDAETQQALQYLLGICAAHVPENPGLITDCPTYIPLNPTTPPSQPTPSAPGAPPATAPSSGAIVTTAAPEVTPPAAPGIPPSVPVTTLTYETTVTTPCSCAEETSVVSTIFTTITVPQVIFTTQTPAQPPAPGVTPSEAPVALVPGTPAPVPAQTTLPLYPIPSNGVPTSLGTVTVPSGSATFSAPAEQFTGAASSVSGHFAPALFGAVLAFFAL